MIKSHVLSTGAGASHYTERVVVVVVPGRNAGDVLRLLGIQPQLGTVMLPVLSEPLNLREAAPPSSTAQHNTDCRQERKGVSEL